MQRLNSHLPGNQTTQSLRLAHRKRLCCMFQCSNVPCCERPVSGTRGGPDRHGATRAPRFCATHGRVEQLGRMLLQTSFQMIRAWMRARINPTACDQTVEPYLCDSPEAVRPAVVTLMCGTACDRLADLESPSAPHLMTFPYNSQHAPHPLYPVAGRHTHNTVYMHTR